VLISLLALVGWVVILVTFKGCTEGARVDTATYASTDGFMRAVWVDRNCGAAARFMGDRHGDGPDWCRIERSAWTRSNLFVVRGSRRLIGDCRPSQLVGVPDASPECISYRLVGRTSAGCRNVEAVGAFTAGCSGGRASRYERELLDLVVAKRHGRWKVVAFFEQTGTECFANAGCAAVMADWAKRVPIHSTERLD
jgi:hypothetical protein